MILSFLTLNFVFERGSNGEDYRCDQRKLDVETVPAWMWGT